MPELKEWLETSGQKLFILDELGKHMGRMDFMTKKTKLILEVLELIRHYDAGFIGISPSSKLVNKRLLDAELLDILVKKRNKRNADFHIIHTGAIWEIGNIGRTSIKFKSKDIAEFSEKRHIAITDLPLCCQVAKIYSEAGSYKQVKNILKLENTQIKRALLEHLQHSLITSNNKAGVVEPAITRETTK
jgi:hypothetical protein